MKRQILWIIGMILTVLPVEGQTRYDYAALRTERLNRGVVAVRNDEIGRAHV